VSFNVWHFRRISCRSTARPRERDFSPFDLDVHSIICTHFAKFEHSITGIWSRMTNAISIFIHSVNRSSNSRLRNDLYCVEWGTLNSTIPYQLAANLHYIANTMTGANTDVASCRYLSCERGRKGSGTWTFFVTVTTGGGSNLAIGSATRSLNGAITKTLARPRGRSVGRSADARPGARITR